VLPNLPAVLGPSISNSGLSGVLAVTDAETITLRLLNPPAGLFLRLRITVDP